MGVNYAQYLIPRENSLRPEPVRIIALIEAWLNSGFVASSPSAMSGSTCILDDRKKERFAQIDAIVAQGITGEAFLKAVRAVPSELGQPFSITPLAPALYALSSSGAYIFWNDYSYAQPDVAYPFGVIDNATDFGSQGPWYSLAIQVSDDYINHPTDNYGGLDGYCKQLNTQCACGYDLRYAIFGARRDDYRVHRLCPTCAREFRPQDQIVEMRDGTSGLKYVERGGLCYRFMISVECGKSGPSGQHGRDPRVTIEFMALCQEALGIDLYEVSEYS
jgi:hypothetical protein